MSTIVSYLPLNIL